jgi:hypothetical protein
LPKWSGSTRRPRVETIAAVAAPVLGLFGVTGQREEGGSVAEPGRGLGLRAQQRGQLAFDQACGSATRHIASRPCGQALAEQRRVHGAAIGALRAHHPLDNAGNAQVQRAVAVVHQAQPHLLDRGLRIHAPRHVHLQVAPAVADVGIALAMHHVIAARLVLQAAATTRRHVPQGLTSPILDQEGFGWRVGHRIVRPGGELVQAAVHGPGVAGAGFGDLRAEARV